MITLTPQQEESIIKEARAELVRHLIATRGRDLELLSGSQVCGMLNVSQVTLDSLRGKLPSVLLSPGMRRYRLSDIEAFIASRIDSTKA